MPRLCAADFILYLVKRTTEVSPWRRLSWPASKFQAAMSHQFPIQEAVFPPLQLSESAKGVFINTALMQLTRALRDYDKYQKWQASQPPSLRYQLHPAMWKPVKTCEHLTVYRRVPTDDAIATAPVRGSRRRARSRTLDAMRLAAATGTDSVSSAPKESIADTSWPIPPRGSGPIANSEWTMPTLLQVGTIEGTLDDVMYGSSSLDAVCTLIKSSYTAEEVMDADTLYEFQGPSPDEPFRFLGLRWVVKSPSSTTKAFVWPRDLTFIAATGVLNRQGGERVGYHLMHSVNLGKGYGPLEGQRIVRGRVSSCYLYRQNSANTVDVYMKTNFEPNGSVHESVALSFAADSLTCCLKSALCAQNKKLSWLLAHPKTNEIKAGSARPSTNRVKKRNDCGVCTRPIGTFSRGHSCRVCSVRACSTCCVKKKLIFPGKEYKTLEQRSVVVCTHCLAHAREMASLEIAKQEVAEGKHLNRRHGTRQGTGASIRSIRSRSKSRLDLNKLRRGTLSGQTYDEREQERAEAERIFLTDPVRKISPTPGQTNSQRKVESNAKPAWDYNSETEDNDNDDNAVESSNEILLPLDSQPRMQNTRILSNGGRAIAKPTHDAAIPVAAQYVDSEAEDDYGYSVHPKVPIRGNSLPEAVVQYAWGAVVPSPEPLAAWPSPLSSPLLSKTPLLKRMEVAWPTAEDEQATVGTSPVPQSTIPRIQAGASTQEVLAQFAELCNAAENVYQAARKHAIVPTPTRFDMSAVD